jgi:hypothetical protein
MNNNPVPKISAAATLLFTAGLFLSACSQKIIMKPEPDFLSAGSYRSRMNKDSGAMIGLFLQLNRGNRFAFTTREAGCQVSEDRGTWNGSQDILILRVEKSFRRNDCASGWESTASQAVYECPLRNVTNKSFQLLHDEIQQGTAWTQWEKEASPSFAEHEDVQRNASDSALSLSTPTRPSESKLAHE